MTKLLTIALGFISLHTCAQLTHKLRREIEQHELSRSVKCEGLLYQFQVLDRDKHGVWFYNENKHYYWFKSQRVISTQGSSSGRLLNGPFEAFYSNKQLAQKGNYNKGLKQGEWLYWSESGYLTKTERWSRGAQRGVQKDFDVNGNIHSTTTIRFGTTKKVTEEKEVKTSN